MKLPFVFFAEIKENWKSDLASGFLVFLIALPLCLGIALASGFPPIAGVITAMVGGLIISPIMGSPLSIKGPAAGLIAIAIASVSELGQGDPYLGYKLTLAVIVASGLVQIIFGLLKFGQFIDFFPVTVVRGMLAGIGIIIIAKQFSVLLGVEALNQNALMLLLEVPSIISKANPHIAIIGIIGLVILFCWPIITNKWLKKIPAPLFVLLVVIPLGHFFQLDTEHEYLFLKNSFIIGPMYLVRLPTNFLESFVSPDFSQLISFTSFKYIMMFTLVGSLESLLTVKAIDEIDPLRRTSNTNKDLIAVGIGNTTSGLIGGLPMIAEVVRSSANVSNGAKTRWSNFFHGLLLLIFVAFFPNLIHQIPLSALAAMLIYTGFRLASPKLFIETYRVGKEQLAIFLVTIIITIAKDLLVGIAAGIVLKFIIELAAGVPFKYLFKSDFEIVKDDQTIILIAKHAAIFSNYLSFKSTLQHLPSKKEITIDFAQAKMVDYTFIEQIYHFKFDYEADGGIVNIIGLDQLEAWSDHKHAVRTAKKGKPKKS